MSEQKLVGLGPHCPGECIGNYMDPATGRRYLCEHQEAAREATPPAPSSVDCPACGEAVRQVASATLSLALWQHWNWACPRRGAAPAPPAEPVIHGVNDNHAPAGETHLHGNTYCYEGDECVICREQKRQATSDSPEAATRYGSDSFQPSAPNGGGSGQYLTPAQAVVIMVRDEMKHPENYVCPDSGVVRFCIPLAHLNILLKAVEGE